MGSKTSRPTDMTTVGTSHRLATFAAGCFWGVEKSFRRKFIHKGIIECQVGYAGGSVANPTYQQVCSGTTGHAEAIQVKFDPSIVQYEELVDFFYRMHDPTALNRQGSDTGSQYRSAILFHDDQQHQIAAAVTEAAQKHYKRAKIQTTLEPVGHFWPAEDYHQDYLAANPHGYECATHFERSWDRIDSQFK